MKIKTTDRLFYRSFPYKAILNPEWGFTAQYFTEKDIPAIQRGDLSDWGFANRAAKLHSKEVISLIKLLAKLDKTQLRKRCENRTLSVFFKDRSLVDKLNKLSKDMVIIELWEPASPEALSYLETNRRVVVKEQLTHGCRYKVALQGSIEKLSPDVRKNFINLVKRNKDEFYISDSLLNDFKKTYRHFWGNYFYVKDGKFLLMAQISLQPIIKEVVKIVTHKEVKQEETANV